MLVAGLVILSLGRHVPDLFTGRLPDNDDLLRLQQARDLLAGQAWYNVDQSRFLTPEGGEMHWSRIPDVFLSGLILIFSPLFGRENAEFLAVALWPLMLLGVMMATLIVAMRHLRMSPFSQIIGLFFLATSSVVYNFWPGRIDHHNLVSLLILVSFVGLIMSEQRPRSAILAGVSLCAALSIAIEALPYAGLLFGLFGLFWVVRGHREASRLTLFGLTLVISCTLFYLLDAPGWGPARAVCDAYGTSHWVALVVGGLGLMGIGLFASNLYTWSSRLMLGAAVGILTLVSLALTNPTCLGNPYADVSALVYEGWLRHVGEARTLPKLWDDDPYRTIMQFGFALAGLSAALLMILRAPDGQRLARLALGLCMALATLTTIWQIRGVTFSHLFGVLAAAWLVGILFEHWRKVGGIGPVLGLCFGTLLMAPYSWSLIALPFQVQGVVDEEGTPANVRCLEPEIYQTLPKDKTLRIFTPIDLGMSVLALSPHEVFAGPYHRNIQGLERVLEIWFGSAASAQTALEAMGADHVLFCIGLNETNRYARTEPQGFAADLTEQRIPDWLEPIPEHSNDRIRLYRIKP